MMKCANSLHNEFIMCFTYVDDSLASLLDSLGLDNLVTSPTRDDNLWRLIQLSRYQTLNSTTPAASQSTGWYMQT